MRKSSKRAAHTMYNTLPRSIRRIPFLEALIGTNTKDLYEAIFDVEVSHEFELFKDENEDEMAMLQSIGSRENVQATSTALTDPESGTPKKQGNSSHPRNGLSIDLPSPRESPSRSRKTSVLSPLVETFSAPEIPSINVKSPLGKLYTHRPTPLTKSTSGTPLDEHPPSAVVPDMAPTVKKMENLLDGLRDTPIIRLRDEMKELQVSNSKSHFSVRETERKIRIGPPGADREPTFDINSRHEE